MTNITWNHITPAHAPPVVSNPPTRAIVYDNNYNRLFYATYLNNGGPPYNSSNQIMEFWKYEAGDFTNLAPATIPDVTTGKFAFSLAYDPVRQVFVMFGGQKVDNSAACNEFWEYDWVSGDWTHISVSSPPSARAGAAMSYDWKNSRMLIFGGVNVSGPTFYQDIYSYDGSSCTALSPPSTKPSTRYYTGMAYDFKKEYMLLFGGIDNVSAIKNDTWVFNLGTDDWVSKSPSTVPSPNVVAPYTLLFPRFGPLLIRTNDNNTHGDINTFEWDGDTDNWIQYTNIATPTPYVAGAYAGSGGFNSRDNYLIYQTQSIPNTVWTADTPITEPPDYLALPGRLGYYKNGAWHLVAEYI